MRTNGVEAAIARYREAETKKYAHNRNCAQRGSAYLGVLLYSNRKDGLSYVIMKKHIASPKTPAFSI